MQKSCEVSSIQLYQQNNAEDLEVGAQLSLYECATSILFIWLDEDNYASLSRIHSWFYFVTVAFWSKYSIEYFPARSKNRMQFFGWQVTVSSTYHTISSLFLFPPWIPCSSKFKGACRLRVYYYPRTNPVCPNSRKSYFNTSSEVWADDVLGLDKLSLLLAWNNLRVRKHTVGAIAMSVSELIQSFALESSCGVDYSFWLAGYFRVQTCWSLSFPEK